MTQRTTKTHTSVGVVLCDYFRFDCGFTADVYVPDTLTAEWDKLYGERVVLHWSDDLMNSLTTIVTVLSVELESKSQYKAVQPWAFVSFATAGRNLVYIENAKESATYVTQFNSPAVQKKWNAWANISKPRVIVGKMHTESYAQFSFVTVLDFEFCEKSQCDLDPIEVFMQSRKGSVSRLTGRVRDGALIGLSRQPISSFFIGPTLLPRWHALHESKSETTVTFFEVTNADDVFRLILSLENSDSPVKSGASQSSLPEASSL